MKSATPRDEYEIYITNAAKKQRDSLSRIGEFNSFLSEAYKVISANPHYHENILKMTGSYAGKYRYKKGKYRIIYEIKREKQIVFLVTIGDRKDVY